MSAAALSDSALPWPVKILPLIVSRSERSMPALRGTRSDEQRVVRVAERGVRVVGLHDVLEQRERAIFELHRDAAQGVERGRDLEELEDHGLVRPEHLAATRRGTGGCNRSGRPRR